MFNSAEILLVLVCLVVSLINTSVGASGGIIFAAMATALPPSAVVPLHGMVILVSSSMRFVLLRPFVNYRFVTTFVLGGAIGFLAAWPLVGRIPDPIVETILGIFILCSVWVPTGWLRVRASIGGALTSCLTLFVGATASLVAALIARYHSDHRVVVATQSACTTFQNAIKVLVFSILGFSFTEHAGLIGALCVSVIMGTWLGKRVLFSLSRDLLNRIMKLIITFLGLYLVLKSYGLLLTELPARSWFEWISVLAIFSLCGVFVFYRVRKDRVIRSEAKTRLLSDMVRHKISRRRRKARALARLSNDGVE